MMFGGLAVLIAGAACGETNPIEPPGAFYVSGTVTDAGSGAPFDEAAVTVTLLPTGAVPVETRTNAAGRYELTFPDAQCRKNARYAIVAAASGGGYFPASGSLPCRAKGSPYVVDLRLVRRP